MADQVEFAPAMYVGLTVQSGTALAQLDFAKVGGGSLRVTIPLHDLARLRSEIDRKQAK